MRACRDDTTEYATTFREDATRVMQQHDNDCGATRPQFSAYLGHIVTDVCWPEILPQRVIATDEDCGNTRAHFSELWELLVPHITCTCPDASEIGIRFCAECSSEIRRPAE
jgi:hypothetical protein